MQVVPLHSPTRRYRYVPAAHSGVSHCPTCVCGPAAALYQPPTTPPGSTAGEADPMDTCSTLGHDYTDPGHPGDTTYGWRACACGGALPGHDDTTPEITGCGMAYRLCRYCDHIDEHPVTDLPADYGRLPDPGTLPVVDTRPRPVRVMGGAA